MEQSHFKGEIDEVRLWNVVRTEDQLRSAMASGLTGTEPGLVALLRAITNRSKSWLAHGFGKTGVMPLATDPGNDGDRQTDHQADDQSDENSLP